MTTEPKKEDRPGLRHVRTVYEGGIIEVYENRPICEEDGRRFWEAFNSTDLPRIAQESYDRRMAAQEQQQTKEEAS